MSEFPIGADDLTAATQLVVERLGMGYLGLSDCNGDHLAILTRLQGQVGIKNAGQVLSAAVQLALGHDPTKRISSLENGLRRPHR